MNPFTVGFAMLLCMVGIHGIFFYEDLSKKIAAWILIQAGILLFLFQAVPAGIPSRTVLFLEIAGVSLVVGGLLGLLAFQLKKRYGTLGERELAKRIPE